MICASNCSGHEKVVQLQNFDTSSFAHQKCMQYVLYEKFLICSRLFPVGMKGNGDVFHKFIADEVRCAVALIILMYDVECEQSWCGSYSLEFLLIS